MSTTHQPVIEAFWQKKNKKITNTESRDGALFLFGNKIAWWQGENVYISDCGWCSRTTQDRLNMFGSIWLGRKKGTWQIINQDSRIWDGSPLKIK